MANIARGEAKCYICHETLTKSCILSYKRSGSVLSVLLYRAWENIAGGLKHWRMANLNQLANKKLANGLTWFQCKGVTEIIGEKKLTNGSQFANFFPLQYFPTHSILHLKMC